MRRFDPIPELGRFLALLGLAGVAISQPVLAAFGDSPETFIFRNAYGGDVVLFALAVSIVPALLLWSAGVAIGFVWPSARADVHGASAGLLVGLAVAQLLSSFAPPVAFGVAALVGVGTWMLIRRFAGARLWSQLLVLLPAYSLMVFLVASPASDAFGSESFEAAKAGPSTTPIVLIVLDELPTASLITPDGQIDSTRFPNLAGLAAESTWYRNATTVAGFTDQAVPAILTGRYPRRAAPFYANFPDNFFRLVAASHDLVASETITRLCPRSACGDHPTPPGRSTEPAQGGADLRGLFGDAFSVWRDGLTGRAHEQNPNRAVPGGRRRRLTCAARCREPVPAERAAGRATGPPRRLPRRRCALPIGRWPRCCTWSCRTARGAFCRTDAPTPSLRRRADSPGCTPMRGPPRSRATPTCCRPATPTVWSARSSTGSGPSGSTTTPWWQSWPTTACRSCRTTGAAATPPRPPPRSCGSRCS